MARAAAHSSQPPPKEDTRGQKRARARQAAENAVHNLKRQLDQARAHADHLLDLVAQFFQADEATTQRLLAVVPALRALLQGRSRHSVHTLRRNVALHARLPPGLSVLEATPSQLRAAQRGPRLGRIAGADAAAGPTDVDDTVSEAVSEATDALSFVTCDELQSPPHTPEHFHFAEQDLQEYEDCFFGIALSPGLHEHLVAPHEDEDEQFTNHRHEHSEELDDSLHDYAPGLVATVAATYNTHSGGILEILEDAVDREIRRPGWTADEDEVPDDFVCVLEWIDMADFASVQHFTLEEHWWPLLCTTCRWCASPTAGATWCDSCTCWWHQRMLEKDRGDRCWAITEEEPGLERTSVSQRLFFA